MAGNCSLDEVTVASTLHICSDKTNESLSGQHVRMSKRESNAKIVVI